MESGVYQRNMSNILNDLGIDKDYSSWRDFALCLGLDTNLFFDKYETDVNIAKAIDESCLSCPVRSICYENGIENNENGVWGGVYLNYGEVDKSKNLHKTKTIWSRLK